MSKKKDLKSLKKYGIWFNNLAKALRIMKN